LAVSVWTGNNDGTLMKNGADGSVIAAPILHEFIEKALAGTPNETFTAPSGIKTVTVEKFSNKLPTTASKETTTDIFASWQVPTTNDAVNNIVKICMGTNLLAPDSLPANLVTTQTFSKVQSEKPSDPSWEGPVDAWAAANGMNQSAPTAYCDANSLTPTVSITSPTNNSTIANQFTATATVKSGIGVSKVQFMMDGIPTGDILTVEPFSTSINAANGQHTLSVILTDTQGTTATDQVTFTVDDIASLQISNLTAVQQSDGIHISWATNKPASSDSVTYQIDSSSVAQKATGNADGLPHSITLTNLSLGKYNYTVSSTSDSGGSIVTATGAFIVTSK
jgi:hypothetical protein